jgi:hypothetical protein
VAWSARKVRLGRDDQLQPRGWVAMCSFGPGSGTGGRPAWWAGQAIPNATSASRCGCVFGTLPRSGEDGGVLECLTVRSQRSICSGLWVKICKPRISLLLSSLVSNGFWYPVGLLSLYVMWARCLRSTCTAAVAGPTQEIGGTRSLFFLSRRLKQGQARHSR